jgi:hypothetical protein
MKYNEKYDRYVDDDLIIYRWDKKLDKLVQCKTYFNDRYYKTVWTKLGHRKVHRVLWETFNGKIPKGYEIDHQDTHKDNNAFSNLILCTHKENMNNPITKHKISESMKGMPSLKRNRSFTEFGRKYIEHFGYGKFVNEKQYKHEYYIFQRDNKCSWEK